jgi:hypothetical protein
MTVATTLNLDQFETKALFESEPRSPGTYYAKMAIRGNAVLSSVYVKSIAVGATVKVNYYDTTTGTDDTGERFDLNSHVLLTDANAGDTNRVLVSRIHNKPQAEIIVTGGVVEFGVYLTVVADFPVDLKGSILDGQTANLLSDGGLPVSVYDPTDGKFYLLQGKAGAITTGSSLETPGNVVVTIAAANVEQAHVFPAQTQKFMLRPRTTAKVLLSYSLGGTVSDYVTISPGVAYVSPLFKPQAMSIYLRSPVGGLEIEAEYWS